ncbi:hypothetical protein [Mycobacterium leprae]|uniref:hypothetical protein n=1 Tax=Mycobacterium leprae TaxID=1769 RepID=UPI0002E10097|nr:hypothetical protein [Mycobacterium leprae]
MGENIPHSPSTSTPGLIPDWECLRTKNTAFVERALHHATTYPARQGHPFNNAINR